MRILVADQNALLLAAIASTFGRHCEIVTATRRDACMEQVEQREFDVVIACEKLADYTGLKFLSEVEAVSPQSLRILAAHPATLKRLGSRLDFLGLLGTLSYPIEARKLVVALKVARGRLPGRPKPPPARHVVLAPPSEKRAAPSPAQPGKQPAPSTSPARGPNGAKSPRAREPTVPTAAQREAFQRALARRNGANPLGIGTEAARGSRTGHHGEPPIDLSGVGVSTRDVCSSGAGASSGNGGARGSKSGRGSSPPSQSLSQLASMATTKRPLPSSGHGVQNKRGAFVVGSGIAAVLLVGVVSFEMLRGSPPADHGRQARTGNAELFSPRQTLMADRSASPPAVFSAPTPQPQTFEPDTAPLDPPPPALEHPGPIPMEPPSMAHTGPPVGMQGGPENGWNSE
jgi:DNA-binding NarL/FixJ family response regulator